MKRDPHHLALTTTLSTGAFAGLVWPRLLHAAGLALRPARIGLGVFALVAVGLIDRLPTLWNKDGAGVLAAWAQRVPEQAGRVRAGIVSGDVGAIGAGLGDLFVRTPRSLFAAAPLSTAVILLLALPVWGMFVLAISRSAATEAGGSERLGWSDALGFARSRWLSGFGVLVTPWVVVYGAILVLAALGWALLNWPWLQVVGGALFVFALPLGLLGVVAMLGLLLGGWMLVPAVACEGSDAIDALQRVYAYTIAKPARIAAYVLILAVAGVLCIGAAEVVGRLVSEFTFRAATLWVHEPLAGMMRGEGTADEAATWSREAAAASVRFWTRVPLLLLAGYAVSYLCCAGTMLYLVVRRVCDGQDMGELWRPGMVPGTYAPELAEDGDE